MGKLKKSWESHGKGGWKILGFLSWDEKPTDMEIDLRENCMGITYGNIAEYHRINSINPWDC
jgi:hypothetical protein